MTTLPTNRTFTLVTNWLKVRNDLGLCEADVERINRDPDRRAKVDFHEDGRQCRIIDYSVPVFQKTYTANPDYGLIVRWEPIV